MKKIKAFFIIFSVAFFINGVAIAGLYKWVDEDGNTHFSDSPPTHGHSSGKVESVSRYRNGAPTVSYFEQESPRSNSNAGNGNSSTGSGNSNAGNVNVSAGNGNSRIGNAESSEAPKVELYSTSWCPYCKMARNFFRSKGIHFTEYDIDRDKSAASRKKQLDSRSGVPFAIINGQKIHGFSETTYENALKQ